MNEEYIQGFIQKCAEAGVDPAELVKSAGVFGDLLKTLGKGGRRVLGMGEALLPGAMDRAHKAYQSGYQKLLKGMPLSNAYAQVPIPELGDLVRQHSNRTARIQQGLKDVTELRGYLGNPSTVGVGAGLGLGIPAGMGLQQYMEERAKPPSIKQRIADMLRGAGDYLE